jgi:hypothetical protein
VSAPLDTGGAGRGGGLLFVAVLLFVAYLALTGLPGPGSVVLAAAIVVGASVLLLRVLRRR